MEPDRECTHAIPRIPRARIDLAGVFATPSAPVTTDLGVRATLPVLEVIVARIGSDGRVVMACVDSEEAARRFLDAPVERLGPAAPKEK